MNMYVNSWKYPFQTSFPHVPFCLPSPLDHLETSPPCLHGFAEPISIVRDHLFKRIYGTYDWKLSWTSLRLNRDNTDSGSLFRESDIRSQPSSFETRCVDQSALASRDLDILGYSQLSQPRKHLCT